MMMKKHMHADFARSCSQTSRVCGVNSCARNRGNCASETTIDIDPANKRLTDDYGPALNQVPPCMVWYVDCSGIKIRL